MYITICSNEKKMWCFNKWWIEVKLINNDFYFLRIKNPVHYMNKWSRYINICEYLFVKFWFRLQMITRIVFKVGLWLIYTIEISLYLYKDNISLWLIKKITVWSLIHNNTNMTILSVRWKKNKIHEKGQTAGASEKFRSRHRYGFPNILFWMKIR